jgi:hypothetical protein
MPVWGRELKRAMLLVGLVSTLGVCAPVRQADGWWYGRTYSPGHPAGYAWRPAPWVLFPFQRPRPDYRYSTPPGAPLSYDDPASGTTYCLSQTTGFYFACAYTPPPVLSARPLPPPPPPGDAATSPASGVLMFHLPQGARASINGVPVGLSDGFGVHAVRPGTYNVVLHIAERETAHTVHVLSRRIFTVTPAGVVATEP